ANSRSLAEIATFYLRFGGTGTRRVPQPRVIASQQSACHRQIIRFQMPPTHEPRCSTGPVLPLTITGVFMRTLFAVTVLALCALLAPGQQSARAEGAQVISRITPEALATTLTQAGFNSKVLTGEKNVK